MEQIYLDLLLVLLYGSITCFDIQFWNIISLNGYPSVFKLCTQHIQGGGGIEVSSGVTVLRPTFDSVPWPNMQFVTYTSFPEQSFRIAGWIRPTGPVFSYKLRYIVSF